MVGSRLPSLFKKISFFSVQNLVRHSSSSSSNLNPRFSTFGSEREKESLVYRHKLQFQRPKTITRKDCFLKPLVNTVSFIGSVLFPVKTMKSEIVHGVWTLLEVQSSRDSQESFKILLMMWDKMAEISAKYLKEDDSIYVQGRLGSYKRVDATGQSQIFYTVTVDKLNYVSCNAGRRNNKKSEKSEHIEEVISTSDAREKEKNRERLHLWQVFFASPHEWWDNRKDKRSPYAPDFRHKDTGECLWLSPKDPPWVGKQLQLQDSRMAGQGYRDIGKFGSRVSFWKYDE